MTGRRHDRLELLRQACSGEPGCEPTGVLWTLELLSDVDPDPRLPPPTLPERSQEPSMFIAMNRFRVHKGRETDFESVWLNRKVHVAGEPGFVEFHLLRGPEHEDHTLFVSHTIWESQDAFTAWTRSQAFKDAHKDGGKNMSMYLDGPFFEGFSVVQRVRP